jgi:magnesium chelatase subunit D
MAQRHVYPFTAIVGQERMRTALLLHAVDPRLGGVLIRGERGTAKSTAVRALASLLPSTIAIDGCPYGCDPERPSEACEACAHRLATNQAPSTAPRAIPVVDLPIGATEDRVLGSLDLEKAIQSGERHFEPGLLARANRGILYVDEVNLLGDHLVDVILDAAAMGRNYVEREGITFSHPATFMLVGTMNPEEGDLRPQLLDRFALAVEVEGLSDTAQRAEVVRRRIAFESDPGGFVASQATEEARERERLTRARALLANVRMPEVMLDLIVRVCAAFQVDGMRGDLAMYRTASALAAYDGRIEVDATDVRLAAELALAHRRRRAPFEQTELDHKQLDRLFDEASPGQNRDDETIREGNSQDHGEQTGENPDLPFTPQATEDQPARPPLVDSEVAERADPPYGALPLRLPSERGRSSAVTSARGRLPAREQKQRGPIDGVRRPSTKHFELALAATLRAAAPYQRARRDLEPGPGLRLLTHDLRENVRRGRAGELVLFLVDASGSMGAQRRMSTTKAAILGLLLDAYRKRDRVGLVAFRGLDAAVLLPPTNSVELAERRLRDLPTGGRTPLAHGLNLSRQTIERAVSGTHTLSPFLIVVTDGRANVGWDGAAPWPAALQQAGHIRRHAWPALVLDTEKGGSGAGLGPALAAALGAKHLSLDRVASGRSLAAGSHSRPMSHSLFSATSGVQA